MLVDATTITKHILGMSILYMLVSASVSVIILLIQNFVLVKDEIIPFSKEGRKGIHDVLDNIFLKLVITLFIFSCLYVGIMNSAVIVIAFILYCIFALYSRHTFDKEEESDDKFQRFINRMNKLISDPVFMLNMKTLSNLSSLISTMINESKENLIEGKYFKFLASKAGVFFTIFINILRRWQSYVC